MDADKMLSGKLSFEHFDAIDPKNIWRVSYLQKWGKNNKRTARCHDYFDNEADAYEFAASHVERGNEVLSVRQFETKDACDGR